MARVFQSVRLSIAWIICLTAVPGIADAAISGFGDFSAFTINQSDAGTPPSTSSGTIELTNLGYSEDRSIFANNPQGIGTFTASFTYQANGLPYSEIGGAFVLQNSSSGVNAVGGRLGYAGIGNSAAITLGIINGGPLKSSYSYSELLTEGSPSGNDLATDPVNLLSGDSINIVIRYDGSTLDESLFDTQTSASFFESYPINLAAVIGSTQGYVGFTGGSGFGEYADQYFSNFQFTNSLPEPASFGVLGLGVMAALVRRRPKNERETN